MIDRIVDYFKHLEEIGIYSTLRFLNYGQKISFLLSIIKGKANREFFIKGGTHYHEQTFYIIRRNNSRVGLFSMYITTAGHIKYALDKGYVPIVDMCNYHNAYQEEADHGKVNSWEYFFFQPQDYSLSDAYSGKNIILSNILPTEIRPNDSMAFLRNKDGLLNEWRKMICRYIKVSPYIQEEVNKIFENFSDGGKTKVLGVLCRGTDYIKLKPKGHPIQPNISELFDKVDEIKMKYKCDKIFLATEDASYENAFKKRYGNCLLTIIEKKVDYSGGYLSDTINDQKQETKISTGLNYLKKILLLSKCQCFVAGRTSGTVGVMLQDHNFECTYFFDKGSY